MNLNALYNEAKEKNTYVAGKCVVGAWAVSLDEANLNAFDTSLNDDDFSTRSLHALYKTAGATFGITSLKEHRNGNCSCR
jgi:hypothetical protein